MNWGYKIMILYLAFAAGIAAMVIKSTSQKIDLVTPDYYEKELKHQERIDAVNRTEALSSKVKYKLTGEKFAISLPAEFATKEASVSLLLYCPSDKNKDLKKDMIVQDGTMVIELPQNRKGNFEIQLSWVADGYAYYFEEKLFL